MPETKLTIEILKIKRKFPITTAFEQDLKFERKLERCQKINEFMKEFPL